MPSNPTASEVCNNTVDDDCDGSTDCADGDCTNDTFCTGCADADGDGFNDSSCGGTDCNDTDAQINPTAAEVCNNTVDDDCDGSTDCGD